MAHWTPRNFDRHYRKHPAGKHKECWMDLLNKTVQVTEPEYDRESKNVVRHGWIEFRAEELDAASYDAYANPGAPPYHPAARYYTDTRLIKTVVNTHNDEIRTCYHEHFDRTHEMGSGSLNSKSEIVDRIIRYLDRLRHRKSGAQLKNLKVLAASRVLPPQIRQMIDELKT